MDENRPVDPGSIEESHRPKSFMRNKYRTRASGLREQSQSDAQSTQFSSVFFMDSS